MAILEKKINPSLRLKIRDAYQQGKKDSDLVNQLLISEGKGGSPNTPTPDWDKDWPKPGTKPRPEDRPNIPTKLAGAQDIDTKMHILPSGMMVDENGIKYIWSPQDQKFIDMGPYDPYYDGNPIPLGQRNAIDDMKIAKKNKRNEQRAYEDFVRDSQNMPLDESFKDLRRGIDREGLDIMKDVLGLDEA
jgi:hypothetical protein